MNFKEKNYFNYLKCLRTTTCMLRITMKEPGDKRPGVQPEIAAILQTTINENDRLPVYENSIRKTNHRDNKNMLEASLMKSNSVNESRNDKELKRKTSLNLENIVTKLKKSRADEIQMNCVKTIELTSMGQMSNYKTQYRYRYEKENKESIFRSEKKSLFQFKITNSEGICEGINDVKNVKEKSCFPAGTKQTNKGSSVTATSVVTINRQHKSLALDSSDDQSEQVSYLKSSDSDQLCKLLADKKVAGKNGSSDKILETKCEKCNKRFYRRSQLIRHLSNHVVHECFKCNAVFYCVRRYKRHIRSHESYPCEYCNEEFHDASSWYQHRAKHTMIECSSCDMIFYSQSALLKHKLLHMFYVCSMCQSAFPDLNYWLSHRAYHAKLCENGKLPPPAIKCRECHAVFTSQELFFNHRCIFADKKPNTKTDLKFNTKDITHLIGVDQTGIQI